MSSDLSSSIEEALRAFRYLIVFCSPDATQSIYRWVNEEIRYFKSLEREDRILAIIIRGEPNAGDCSEGQEEECFPPALRYQIDAEGQLTEDRYDPLGGDLRPGGDGRTGCLLKSVAGITGLGYNASVKREDRRRHRNHLLAAVTAMLVLAGSLFFWWDYTRVKAACHAQLRVHTEITSHFVDVKSKCGSGHFRPLASLRPPQIARYHRRLRLARKRNCSRKM